MESIVSSLLLMCLVLLEERRGSGKEGWWQWCSFARTVTWEREETDRDRELQRFLSG